MTLTRLYNEILLNKQLDIYLLAYVLDKNNLGKLLSAYLFDNPEKAALFPNPLRASISQLEEFKEDSQEFLEKLKKALVACQDDLIVFVNNPDNVICTHTAGRIGSANSPSSGIFWYYHYWETENPLVYL